MRLRIVAFVCLSFLLTAALIAQEKGSDPSGVWFGDYGTSPQSRTEIQVMLKWDGKVLTGAVVTEEDRLNLENASFDPSTGAVHLEVTFRGRGAPGHGNTYHYIVDGKLEKDTITGIWHNEFDKGDFALKKIY